jgi:O-acetyl-ADP-ribose deacetylase (regulator of RNase III)
MSAYKKSLGLADWHECKSMAFPRISANIFGLPPEAQAKLTCRAIREWILAPPGSSIKTIKLCVLPKEILDSEWLAIDAPWIKVYHTFLLAPESS